MRRHGWAGKPPASDEEARQRILDAAMVCVDERGAMETSLSAVATAVGVTRQTVYRYFPSTESLFSALAEASADEFIGRIAARMQPLDDPVEAMIEGLAFTIEAIPNEQYLALLLRTEDAFARGIISDVAMDFGRSLLERSHIDWSTLGYVGAELDGFVEFQLRLIQSMALTPVTPDGTPRDERQLRTFLHRWLAPTIRVPAREPVPTAARSV